VKNLVGLHSLALLRALLSVVYHGTVLVAALFGLAGLAAKNALTKLPASKEQARLVVHVRVAPE
jgi:hypothetical protein